MLVFNRPKVGRQSIGTVFDDLGISGDMWADIR